MKRSEVIATLLVVNFLFGCSEKKEINVVKPDEQLFVYLEKLSQDKGKRAEYIGIIEKLSNIVKEAAGKNPQAYSSFIEEIVQLVPQAGPGVAIQLEGYADEAVRNEMKRLRKESSVANFSEKERIINELTRENTRLTGELSKYRKLEVNLSAERVNEFLMVRMLNHSSFGLQLDRVGLWDDVRKWPEKAIESNSAKRYQTNEIPCYFSQSSADGILPIEFKASNRNLRFVAEKGFWDQKKPLKYLPVVISSPGQPKMFMPVVQLTDDGFDYMRGWILEEELNKNY